MNLGSIGSGQKRGRTCYPITLNKKPPVSLDAKRFLIHPNFLSGKSCQPPVNKETKLWSLNYTHIKILSKKKGGIDPLEIKKVSQ